MNLDNMLPLHYGTIVLEYASHILHLHLAFNKLSSLNMAAFIYSADEFGSNDTFIHFDTKVSIGGFRASIAVVRIRNFVRFSTNRGWMI